MKSEVIVDSVVIVLLNFWDRQEAKGFKGF